MVLRVVLTVGLRVVIRVMLGIDVVRGAEVT